MKIDKNVELKIIDFDYKGNGVAKYDGRIVFLDGGIIGDKVLAKLTQEKKSFYKGRVIKTLEKSKNRVESKCPYSKKCGGCDFLEYDYNDQLNWKEGKVKNDLLRIGGVNPKIESILGMENPYNYRNNIQLQVRDEKIGFFEKNSKSIVQIDSCIVAKEGINEVIKLLKDWKGLRSVKTISIRENYKKEIMIVFITEEKVQKLKSILSELIDLNVVSIFENVNKKSKYRFSENFNKLYGEDYFIDKIGELEFKLSPESFFQVNPYQVEKLYKTALDNLDINSEDTIFDLYCGIGTLSLMAAKNAKEVIGVEIVESAVDDARVNAELNKIENAIFIAGKSEIIMEKLVEDEKIIPNKVILDPPRAGIDESLVEKILEIKPEKIAYISCNPSTQARDIALLKDDYKIEFVKPVDMFSNTVHVENVVILVRK